MGYDVINNCLLCETCNTRIDKENGIKSLIEEIFKIQKTFLSNLNKKPKQQRIRELLKKKRAERTGEYVAPVENENITDIDNIWANLKKLGNSPQLMAESIWDNVIDPRKNGKTLPMLKMFSESDFKKTNEEIKKANTVQEELLDVELIDE